MANINKIRLSGTTYDIQDINVSAHTANTDIHVTASDKTNWNGKVDADFDNSLGFDINDDLGVYAEGNYEEIVFNTASSKVKEYTFPSVYTNGSNNLYKVGFNSSVSLELNQSFSGTVSTTKAIGVKYLDTNDELKECWWDYSNNAFTINSDYSANNNVRLTYNSSSHRITLGRQNTSLKTIVTIMVGGDYYIASSSNPTEADCYISYIKISTTVKKLQSVLNEKQRKLTPGDGIELDYSGNISANIKVTGDTREKVFNKATSATSINSLEETSISFNVNTGYTGDTTSTWANLAVTNINVRNEYVQAYIKYDAQNDSFSILNGGDYITISYSANVLTVTAHKITVINSNNGFAALNDFDNVGCLFGKVYTNSNVYTIQEAIDNKVDTSDVTTAVTSGSTDSQIPSAKAVYDAIQEGGGSSYTAGDGIDISNDVISVTGKVSTSDFNTYSASTNTRLAEDEEVTAAALVSLNDRVSEDEEVTAAALVNLNEAVSAHTANTSIHVSAEQIAAWNAKSDFSGSYNDLTNKLSAGTNVTIVGNVINAEGGGGGTVETAITSGSTNAVESKAIWSATTYNKEVTLQWDNGFPAKYSTNYPSGCKKFVVTVPSNNAATIFLYNGGSQIGDNITIITWGSVTVSIEGLDGITYTISGNDVTFVVPDTITFDNLRCDIRYITSIKAIVEGAWIADNTYMKSEVDVIQNTLQNNINQKLDSTAYTPTVVDSALNVASTNPVENQALYSELRINNGGGEAETTLTFENNYSTNYPNGCTKLKVEVVGSMNNSTIYFLDNNNDSLGWVNINNYYDISVDNNFQGATYEISGTTVIISYPTVPNVTKIQADNGNYVYIAVTTGASTVLKDQVVENTTALGGLSLVKLTQAQYDALATKDNSTLYVIVN